MKSLSCWFKSKADKSMFQERIPEKGKETKKALNKVRGLDFREVFQAHRRGKGIRTTAMISLTDILKKGV